MHFLILKTYFPNIEKAFNFSNINNQILILKIEFLILENEFLIHVLKNLCNFLIRKYIVYLISGNEFLIFKKFTIRNSFSYTKK